MAEMTKLDLKKELKNLYNPSKKDFTVVEAPPMNFLMIDGQGDPNTAPAFPEATKALYAVSYNIKFASKKEPGVDYVVMPLEGLWWAEDMAAFDVDGDRDTWQWTLMVMQPEHITADMVEQAIEKAARKEELTALDGLRLETYHEGLSAQIMHIGPYAEEGPTLARLHREFMPDNGYAFNGHHHEIYLSDPRRVAPERMKTVLRQPVRKT